MLTYYDTDTQSANKLKICRLCVCVIINKHSFEPFVSLDLVLEHQQSFLFQIFTCN